MPDRSCITVFFLTPLIFRYHLPLKVKVNISSTKHWLIMLHNKDDFKKHPCLTVISFQKKYTDCLEAGQSYWPAHLRCLPNGNYDPAQCYTIELEVGEICTCKIKFYLFCTLKGLGHYGLI
jgi:hypothetical protein